MMAAMPMVVMPSHSRPIRQKARNRFFGGSFLFLPPLRFFGLEPDAVERLGARRFGGGHGNESCWVIRFKEQFLS
jgi:hypothetical protein